VGLIPDRWLHFDSSLDPEQREIMMGLKAGTSVESIAKSLKVKTNQVMGE